VFSKYVYTACVNIILFCPTDRTIDWSHTHLAPSKSSLHQAKMSGTKFQDTDPLIRAGQKRSPADYGLQGESEETERSFESGSSSFRDILKGRERVFQVAVCCLTVCLASLLSGMGLGFSSATILELTNKTITQHSQILTKTEQSLFAVSTSISGMILCDL